MIRTKLMQPRAGIEPRLESRLGALQSEHALSGQDGNKRSQPHQNGAHPQSIKQSEPPTTHTRLFDAAPPFKEVQDRWAEMPKTQDLIVAKTYLFARVSSFLGLQW